MSARKYIFYFFVWVNFLAFIYFYFGGVATKSINNVYDAERSLYVINIFLVLASLYVVVKFYNVIDQYTVVAPTPINIRSLGRTRQNIIGLFIFFMQLYYIYHVSLSGGHVAGGESKLGGGLSGAVIAITQIQTLQIVYLISIPNYKSFIWRLVLITFVVQSILQGWSSMYLLLAIMYLFHLSNNGKIRSYSKITVIAIFLTIFVYPLIYTARLLVRISGQNDIPLNEVQLFEILQVENVFEYFLYTYVALLERFQQFYLSLGALVNFDEIVNSEQSGNIIPYFIEGPQKIFLSGFLDLGNAVSMGSFLPSVFYDDAILGDYFWNISPGIVSYFYLSPVSPIFIIPYFYSIIFITIILMKSIRPSKLFFDIFYYLIIMLLFAGWISQFMYFIWSVIFFYLLVLVTGILITGRKYET